MDQTPRTGPVGAILDEYERGSDELNSVLQSIETDAFLQKKWTNSIRILWVRLK
jgi:hypothetical protein